MQPTPRLTLTGPSRSPSRLLSLALHMPVQARARLSGPDLEHLVRLTSPPVPVMLRGHRLSRLLQLGLIPGTGLLRGVLMLLCEVTTRPRLTVHWTVRWMCPLESPLPVTPKVSMNPLELLLDPIIQPGLPWNGLVRAVETGESIRMLLSPRVPTSVPLLGRNWMTMPLASVPRLAF